MLLFMYWMMVYLFCIWCLLRCFLGFLFIFLGDSWNIFLVCLLLFGLLGRV